MRKESIVSETLNHHEKSPEDSHEKFEHIDETLVEKHEHLAKTPEKQHESIQAIEQKVERQHPTKSAELLDRLEPDEDEKPIHPPNKELKTIALSNYLSDIRSHLSSGSKTLSKFIHKPTINAISEVSGKTIVRPTAILFGGLFMFIGSALYLYATYHTNARYNFLVALFLFFGGFMAGIVIELFYNLFFKKSF